MLVTKCLLDSFVLLEPFPEKRIHFPVLENMRSVVVQGLLVLGLPVSSPAQLAVVLFKHHYLNKYVSVRSGLTSTHLICASKIDYASSVLHLHDQKSYGSPRPSLL